MMRFVTIAWQRWFGLPISVRIAVGLWIALILGVVGRVVFSPITSQSVVTIYRIAGERWLATEPLYPPLVGLDLYRNPPAFAALFATMDSIPEKLAAILWRLLGLALFLWGFRDLLKHAMPMSLNQRQQSVIWSITAFLIIPAFNNGQVNLHILGTAVLGIASAARQRWWLAATMLSFAIMFKVYPIAIAGLAVVLAPRPLVGRLILILGLIHLAPMLSQSPSYFWSQHVEFINEMQLDDRSTAALSRAPKDWTILARRITGEPVPRTLTQAVSILMGLGLAWRMTSQRHSEWRWLEALSLGLIWCTLFGPATEMNTYSMLAPVAAWMLVCRPRSITLWLATSLLILSVARGAFAGDAAFQAIGFQAIAAALMILNLLAKQPSRTPISTIPSLLEGRYTNGNNNTRRKHHAADSVDTWPNPSADNSQPSRRTTLLLEVPKTSND